MWSAGSLYRQYVKAKRGRPTYCRPYLTDQFCLGIYLPVYCAELAVGHTLPGLRDAIDYRARPILHTTCQPLTHTKTTIEETLNGVLMNMYRAETALVVCSRSCSFFFHERNQLSSLHWKLTIACIMGKLSLLWEQKLQLDLY